jgi:hypothetical protein
MRFTRKTISKICQDAGFEIEKVQYVRAGFRSPPFINRFRPSLWGKEILLLLSKPKSEDDCV